MTVTDAVELGYRITKGPVGYLVWLPFVGVRRCPSLRVAWRVLMEMAS